MLPEVNPLPGAEYEAAVCYRDRQMHPRQYRADMGRHVVRPLLMVAIALGAAVGRKPIKGVLEIEPHIWVGVLLNGQRSRAVLTKQGEQSNLYLLGADPVGKVRGDRIQAWAGCIKIDNSGDLTHGLRLEHTVL